MAGPTPVSALIHAATMVTAGVYMVVRCNAIYQNAPTAMLIVAIIGCRDGDLCRDDRHRAKRHQEGSRLLDRLAARIYVPRVRRRGVYRRDLSRDDARVFQGAAVPRLGFGHSRNASRAGHAADGQSSKSTCPITFITMVTGLARDLRHPDLGGLFLEGRDPLQDICRRTILPDGRGTTFCGASACITAVLTAIYMTRMMVMTFFGEERFHEELAEWRPRCRRMHDAMRHDSTPMLHDDDDEEHHHALPPNFKPHESPWTMTVPLDRSGRSVDRRRSCRYSVRDELAVGAVTSNVFEHTLEPVIAKVGKKDEHAAPAAKPHASTVDRELKDLYASAERRNSRATRRRRTLSIRRKSFETNDCSPGCRFCSR